MPYLRDAAVGRIFQDQLQSIRSHFACRSPVIQVAPTAGAGRLASFTSRMPAASSWLCSVLRVILDWAWFRGFITEHHKPPEEAPARDSPETYRNLLQAKTSVAKSSTQIASDLKLDLASLVRVERAAGARRTAENRIHPSTKTRPSGFKTTSTMATRPANANGSIVMELHGEDVAHGGNSKRSSSETALKP